MRGRRRTRRRRGSRGGGVAGVSESGVPGADSSRIWVGRHLREMGKPMEATAGNGRARECENGCGGGSAWRITPASGVLTSSASYGSTQLAQSDQGGELTLTEGAGWGLLQRRSAGGGSACGARGPVGGAPLGSSRLHVRARGVPATKPRGSARFGLHRRRGKTAAR